MALLTADCCPSFGELGMLAASGRRQAFRFRWPNLTTAVPLHGQRQDVGRTPRERASQNDRTEINGESTSNGVANLGIKDS